MHAFLPMLAVAALTGLFGLPIAGAEPQTVWETPAVLSKPESVAWDARRQVYYVSNINGEATEASGAGFLSRLGPDGTVLEREWVTGLNAPKGLLVVGEVLYVAEVGGLVEVDLERGAVAARHAAPGSQFLNDLAVDGEGRVYVSDLFTDTVWRLAEGRLEPWLATAELLGPNGLHVDGERLYVAAWGRRLEGFQTETPGHLLVVSLADGTVGALGEGTPIGHLDGLEPLGEDGFLVSAWKEGLLMEVSAEGRARVLADLGQGSADLEYRPEENLAIVPLMNQNRVRALRLK